MATIKNFLYNRAFGICHTFWCTSLHHIPSEARSSLAELLFVPATSPPNDFHRCLHESPSSHNRFRQVGIILGEDLKKIVCTKFHEKGRTSQICIGSGKLGVYPLAACGAGGRRQSHPSMLGVFQLDKQVWWSQYLDWTGIPEVYFYLIRNQKWMRDWPGRRLFFWDLANGKTFDFLSHAFDFV